MTPRMHQPWAQGAWALTRTQHGVVSRTQLVELGMSPDAIRNRLANGRLHEIHRGVYVVGREELSRHGELMAAVLACGPGAQLSHRSGAELWGIRPRHEGPIDVAVSAAFRHRRPGIRSHRRGDLRHRFRHRIPVGDPTSILVDLATCLADDELEDAVNEADRRDLVVTPRLRSALDAEPLLGRYRVDFFWSDLGLVIETDSLRHHRTAAEQAVDFDRDQAHVRVGLRTLRFTHAQVFRRPDHVRAVLVDTFRHLPGRP